MFDPYHKWLGIPPAEQPPNYYRLLGIQLFESDEDVIASSADRQMAYVKSFAGGPCAAAAEQLLNELAKARVCLLKSETKEAYDAALRRTIPQGVSGQGAIPAGISLPLDRTSATHLPGPELARETAAPGHGLQPTPGAIQADPFSSIPEVRIAAGNSVLQRAGRYRASKRNWYLRLLGHLVFSFLGLAIAWILLAKVGPQFDFLNIFDHSKSSTAGPASRTQVDPPLSDPSARAPRNSSADGGKVQRQGSLNVDPSSQSSSGEKWLQHPANSAVEATGAAVHETGKETELPAHSLIRPEDMDPHKNTEPEPNHLIDSAAYPDNPFSNLPAETDLPPLEGTDILFGTIDLPVETPLMLRIIPLDNPHRLALKFYADPIAINGAERKWNVYFADDEKFEAIKTGASDLEAIAEFRVVEGVFSMHWLPGAQLIDWSKLSNCLVEVTAGGSQHLMQLRRAIVGEPARMEDRDTPLALNFSLDELPATANLFLAVTQVKNFPPLQPYQGDPEKIPENQLTIWSFADTAYAGLGVQWERHGNHISIKIAPGYQLDSEGPSRIVLGSSDLARREKVAIKNLGEWRVEINRRIISRSALQQQLSAANSMSIRNASGIVDSGLIGLRKRAILRARAAINTNEARILALNGQIPTLEQDLGRVPKLKELAFQIEGRATVGLRIYSLAEGNQVILFANDRPDHTESSESKAGL
ncbi:MAG: hypothetical protein JW829_07525 [Pirellulales bacterium]|nr:hypothetical protein [Pirellulales bacterium]